MKRGLYREVLPAERVVRTEALELDCVPQSGDEVGTLVLTEQDGNTALTCSVLYRSKQARDATIVSGVEQKVAAGCERLDGVAAVTDWTLAAASASAEGAAGSWAVAGGWVLADRRRPERGRSRTRNIVGGMS